MDKVSGFLEVGINDNNEIVINHPDLKPDADGVGHIVFSVEQATSLARLLDKNISDAVRNIRIAREEKARKEAEANPVDRSDTTLTDGSPVTPDHRELKNNGQQADYVVLSDAERAKGFVRPVRRSYQHVACGGVTTMSQSIAETYARDPKFYGGTFCTQCGQHFDLVVGNGERQFVWADDGSGVGT